MKTLIALMLLVVVSPLSSPVLAAGKTAKALLPQAVAAAKEWQPDAALVNLETENAGPDGTVPVEPLPGVWAYTFLSPKTKKKLLVMVDATGDVSTFDSSYYQNELIGDFTVDSDQAMATAIKNGLKTHNFGMSMTLESRNGKPVWQMLDEGHFYYVDAASGTFLRKEKLTEVASLSHETLKEITGRCGLTHQE